MTTSADTISQQVSAELHGSVTIIGKHHYTTTGKECEEHMHRHLALYDTIQEKKRTSLLIIFLSTRCIW